MDVASANKILDNYVKWWRDAIEVHQEGNAVRVICPMLDRHNDHFSIYMNNGPESGEFVLSDLGATILDLSASGCNVVTGSRQSKLDEVLNGFGIDRSENELYVVCSSDHLFSAINMLMQGMATVDDLFFTVRENVRNLFSEDVGYWFEQHGIRNLPNVFMRGQSGFETKFDFIIPKTPNAAPERFIKTVSTPSEQSVVNALFGWGDIKSARGDESAFYLFLNQRNCADGAVDDKLLRACYSYDVRPVVWGRDEQGVLDELAA